LLRDRMTPVFYPYLRVHMDPQHTFDPRDDEIDLFELFESLWKERVLIVAITFFTKLTAF